MLKRKKGKGFSLIELLIVVAIIGIIAAIAIPNLLSALQKGRQKRTMGDIKSLGTAIETINTDCAAYPTYSGPVGDPSDCSKSANLIAKMITGGAIQNVIACDGWRQPLQYDNLGSAAVAVADPNCTNTYTNFSGAYLLWSKGRYNADDCKTAVTWTGTSYNIDPAATCGATSSKCAPSTDFACDISFGGGSFLTYPEGMQK
jgi:type II secretion system protein G